MSYEEFLEWSAANEPHAEWVDGEIFIMPAVSDEHTWVSGYLITLFSQYAAIKDLGTVYHDPYQMKLGSGPGRQPDVFFVRKENATRLQHMYCNGPADLAVEITSPGSRRTDRVIKFAEYERGGVMEYWIIDPKVRSVEFYVRDHSGLFQEVLVGEDDVYRSRELPGFWFNTDWLWSRPPLTEVFKWWNLP